MSSTCYGKVYISGTTTVITTATVVAPPYTVNCLNGVYTFTTPGACMVDVTASAPGYNPQTQRVTLAAGQRKKVDFQLTPVA